MADEQNRTEDWKTLPWKQLQRNVFRLQKRIYQAQICGDQKHVRGLQRLLLRSYSARCLAVRQVSQDNRGKNTSGVDGISGDCLAEETAMSLYALRTTLHDRRPPRNPPRNGNQDDNSPANQVLLHGHCHDDVHRIKYS